MTEQATERRTHNIQVVRGWARDLNEAADLVPPDSEFHASDMERGFHYLHPRTRVHLHLETDVRDKKLRIPAYPIDLEEGLEVAFAVHPVPVYPELPKGLVPVAFVPDSPKRRKAIMDRNRGGEGFDVAAVYASSGVIQREDARLAQTFLTGREHLIRGGIPPAEIKRVVFIAGVRQA